MDFSTFQGEFCVPLFSTYKNVESFIFVILHNFYRPTVWETTPWRSNCCCVPLETEHWTIFRAGVSRIPRNFSNVLIEKQFSAFRLLDGFLYISRWICTFQGEFCFRLFPTYKNVESFIFVILHNFYRPTVWETTPWRSNCCCVPLETESWTIFRAGESRIPRNFSNVLIKKQFT